MPQVSTPSEAFATMTTRFAASKAAGVAGSIQFNLTGDSGGKWALQFADDACQVVEGGIDSPNATLTMSDEDFVGLVNGTVNAMAAFMQGKIKLEGDMGMALKLQSLFGIA